ncbi:MAG: MoaD/ThiS family protein [Gemmatimonadales bacterium]
MSTLTIHCRFFARYAELLGCERVDVPVPNGATVADLVARVRASVPSGDRLPVHLMAAVNRTHVPSGHSLTDGDEVAFLPPLAGG